MTVADAYALGLSPFGLLGLHHCYLGNWFFAVTYTLTLGLLGVGWLVDLFTMPLLVRRARERPAAGLGYAHKSVEFRHNF